MMSTYKPGRRVKIEVPPQLPPTPAGCQLVWDSSQIYVPVESVLDRIPGALTVLYVYDFHDRQFRYSRVERGSSWWKTEREGSIVFATSSQLGLYRAIYVSLPSIDY